MSSSTAIVICVQLTTACLPHLQTQGVLCVTLEGLKKPIITTQRCVSAGQTAQRSQVTFCQGTVSATPRHETACCMKDATESP